MNIKNNKSKILLSGNKESSLRKNLKFNNSNKNNFKVKPYFVKKSFIDNIKLKSIIKKIKTNKDKKFKFKEKVKKKLELNKLLLNNNGSFSFINSNRSKYSNSNSILSNNKTNTKLISSEKKELNCIINKLKKNKSAAMLLLNKDKKMKLNSLSNITHENLKFLLSNEENKTFINSYKNKKNKPKYFKKEDNSLLLSSKMIDLFNKKTSSILNSPNTSLRILSNSNSFKFRSDLINNLDNNIDSKEMIKKLKKKYNEAEEIYENRINLQTQKALKYEKDFYKLKNEENIKKNNNLYKKILSLNKRRDTNRKSTISPGKRMELISNKNVRKFSIRIVNNNDLKNPQLLYESNKDSKKFNRYFSNNALGVWKRKKYLHLNKSEEEVNNAHKKYEIFQKKKIKENSQKFAKLITDLIYSNYKLKINRNLDKKTKKIEIIHNDLIRLKKLKKMGKNINNIQIDEFRIDYNKLREKMLKSENEYYKVNNINNKKNLSFLKPYLKTSTIKKFISLKYSNFGIP